MKRSSLLIGVCLLALCTRQAGAQEVPARLGLEDAIRIARTHNPQFRQVTNDREIAAARERQNIGGLLPDLSASIGFSGQKSRQLTGLGDLGEIVDTPTFVESTLSNANQGIDLTITLFDGGANLNRIREGRANTRAVEARIDARAAQLRADVTRAYYDLLRAERAAQVEEQLLASAREQLSMTQRRFEIGSARREDVLGAEATVAIQEQRVGQAVGNARKRRLLLLREMGVQGDVEFELTGELPEIFDPADLDADSLLAIAAGVNPRIIEWESEIRAREHAASVARGARLPRITARAGFSRSVYGKEYDAFFELEPPNRTFSFGISASLPIFNRFQTAHTIVTADAAVVNAKEQLRAERMALEVEVRSTLVDLQNAYRAVQLAERTLALSQERLELTWERYRIGGNVSFVELQNVIDGAATAERDAVDARFAFAAAVVELEAKLGMEVSR